MGVTGLWRLIEPAGKPVPVETLENKVLAVDVSIWLHQMVKGYQDAKGAPLPNAHLMGLFQRLCKLLYFRIKPVFVFDGGFPDLKRETISKRQDNKAKYNSESERLKRDLALLLSKKTAVSSLLGKQLSPIKGNTSNANDDDIFKLPALPEKTEESESDSEEDSSGSTVDLHSVDIESENFKNMSVKDKYNLLIDLKETRKMNSWGKLHELPKKSDNFSDFQMQRLLKRRKVQECLEETEKEMGDSGLSLNDLESLLNEEGIDTKIDSLPTRRIASDNTTRILIINNVKQALAEARQRQEGAENKKEINKDVQPTKTKKDELSEDLERAMKMSLESNEANTSNYSSKTDDSWTSAMTDSDYSDSEEDDGFEQPDMNCAKAYIMQYSDFTHEAINHLVGPKYTGKGKPKTMNVDKIIQELNAEKSIILDNIDLSSGDDEDTPDNTKSLEQLQVKVENLESLDSMDATQTSVVFVDNPVPEIINLDTSRDSLELNKNMGLPGPSKEIESLKSDSSDDDLEEVPEVEDEHSHKPIVELTLNMGAAPEKDDIFADIFTNKSIEETTNMPLEQNFETFSSKATNVKGGHDKTDDVNKNNIRDQAEKTIEPYITDNCFVKPSTSGVKVVNNTLQHNKSDTIHKDTSGSLVYDSDEELKMAIQMSLECAEDTNKCKITEKVSTEHKNQNSSKIAEIAEVALQKKKTITKDDLNTMAQEIQYEEQNLVQEKGRLDRIGRNITEQMTKEAQELLQIFGIPYVVAPMEAEAQCAFLETVNLTDGTITDDSDIWLFGGRTVYKNFFNQKKHVMQFQAERIERSFNLTREQLVLLALLVGSDYTTGVTGVGPVTALEILASFPFNNKQSIGTSKQARYSQIVTGLQEFKKWVRAGKKTDNTTLKKKLRNVDLTEDFPSIRVVQAYMEPNVEKSKDKFTWGELDITILRDYTKTKFGWSQNKLDEIIKPVLKRLIDRKSQRSVQDYFKRKVEFQSLEEQMSKRVKAAVQKMGPDGCVLENNEKGKGKTKCPRKRKASKNKTDQNESELGTNEPPKPKNAKHLIAEETEVLNDQCVTVVSQLFDSKSGSEIVIPKTDRFQELIPQREKDKQSLLQNKLKAIEIFRKNKMDKKRKPLKRKVNLPKEKAELSESDSE